MEILENRSGLGVTLTIKFSLHGITDLQANQCDREKPV